MMFSLASLNTSLQSCRDSKASYNKMTVYSFFSTAVVHLGFGNFVIHATFKLVKLFVSRPPSGPYKAVGEGSSEPPDPS